jgi:protoporphyrinogen oxidase
LGRPRKQEQSKGATSLQNDPIVIVGAGPAGLTAAYELVTEGLRPVVLEKADKVGGIARTETHSGYRFDIGGHRFFTKVEEVQRLWEDMLGDDFLKVSRLSHIYFQDRFLNYPIDVSNVLSNLGIVESLLILLSYFRAQLWPYPEEETFEQWVSNRLGHRLFETFFRSYTEKVWGIPCHEIQADWAAQRIRGLSLTSAVSNALSGATEANTLIQEFRYPVLGPGMMWQRFCEAVESHGGEIHLNTKVVRVNIEGHRVKNVVAQRGAETVEISGKHFVSSMPLTELVAQLDPPPPADVGRTARKLRYRAFAIVGLVVDQAEVLPDNWLYVHSGEVKVARIQNFKNWSGAMVPDNSKTSLGMEYFCDEGDEIWTMSDADLVEMATRELVCLGLADSANVEDGVVFRQPKAYPVYDSDYSQHLDAIRSFLATLDNLQTIGRNGLHRYNNQDHSMLTGILAARNILGEHHDLWNVNTDRSYYEGRIRP